MLLQLVKQFDFDYILNWRKNFIAKIHLESICQYDFFIYQVNAKTYINSYAYWWKAKNIYLLKTNSRRGNLMTSLGFRLFSWFIKGLCTNTALSLRHSAYTSCPSYVSLTPLPVMRTRSFICTVIKKKPPYQLQVSTMKWTLQKSNGIVLNYVLNEWGYSSVCNLKYQIYRRKKNV